MSETHWSRLITLSSFSSAVVAEEDKREVSAVVSRDRWLRGGPCSSPSFGTTGWRPWSDPFRPSWKTRKSNVALKATERTRRFLAVKMVENLAISEGSWKKKTEKRRSCLESNDLLVWRIEWGGSIAKPGGWKQNGPYGTGKIGGWKFWTNSEESFEVLYNADKNACFRVWSNSQEAEKTEKAEDTGKPGINWAKNNKSTTCFLSELWNI